MNSLKILHLKFYFRKHILRSVLGVMLWMTSATLLANTDKYRLTFRDDPSTTIVVGFNAINGTGHTVYYGTTNHGTITASYPFSRAVDHQVSFRGMNNSFVRISGLQPKTRYYFVVGDNNSVSNVMYFETITDNPNDTVSFIAGGDSRQSSGSPDASIEWGNEMVRKLKPDAVLFGGDMTNNGSNGEWQDWFDKWQLTIGTDGRMTPIVATQGNHESGPDNIYNLFDVPDQDNALAGNHAYYALSFGGNLVRSYTLNSDEEGIITDQSSWLQNDFNSNTDVIWKTAQYHQPIAPHKKSKDYRTDLYSNWAQLFYENGVRLVVECDAHVVKETDPVKPTGNTNDANSGFVYDEDGTCYAGEGTWRALRSVDQTYPFTRASGSFNQVKWVIVSRQEIHLRTILTENVASVTEVSSDARYTPPTGLEVWNNHVTIIRHPSSPKPVVNIVSPINGANYTTPQTVTLEAVASDADGSITHVDFYVNNSLVGTKFGAPYAMDFDFTADGEYDIKVVATDNDGQSTSKTNTMTIGEVPDELIIPVSASADDAEEQLGSPMITSSSDLEMVMESSKQVVGIRFQNVNLPANAIIEEAYIRFTVDEVNTETTDLTIYGENSINPLTFSDANKIIGRSKTSAVVNWSPDEWNITGAKENSADLTSIINELKGKSGYTPNNPMVFIISGSGKRVASSYDEAASLAPVLHIKYSTSAITGIEEKTESDIQFVRPSIFTNSTSISTEGLGTGPFEVKVLDMSGHVVHSTTIYEGHSAQFGNMLAAGMYSVFMTNNEHLWSMKIMKTNR